MLFRAVFSIPLKSFTHLIFKKLELNNQVCDKAAKTNELSDQQYDATVAHTTLLGLQIARIERLYYAGEKTIVVGGEAPVYRGVVYGGVVTNHHNHS